MVSNAAVAVGIMSPAHCVQWLLSLPVSVSDNLNSVDDRRREISGNVDSVISKSDIVESVGIEVEIASLSQAVQKLLPLPFLRPASWISGRRRGPICFRG